MAKSRPPYPTEFRQQMVELVRSGRTPSELAREFEPSAQSICTWVRQADAEDGHSTDMLTADELRTEREILSKAAAWFAQETNATSTNSSRS